MRTMIHDKLMEMVTGGAGFYDDDYMTWGTTKKEGGASGGWDCSGASGSWDEGGASGSWEESGASGFWA